MNEDAAPIYHRSPDALSPTSRPSDAIFTYTIVSGPAAAEGSLTGGVRTGPYTFDSADDFNGTATFTY